MTAMRSLLFVPANAERKIAKATSCGADVVILDLEDSVAAGEKAAARSIARDVLSAPRPCRIFVRVNAVATGVLLDDLTAILPAVPDGLVLPKSESAASVNSLASVLQMIAPGAPFPPVIAIATETARSMFHMGSYAGAHACLAGLAWGMEDLAAEIGATSNRKETGDPTDPYVLARTLCLLAARAAGVEPVDAVYTAFRDLDGLAAEARNAARDGFTAKMCIHPDQVAVINQAFTPAPAEIEKARRIVDAFAKAGNPGVISLDGAMLDVPHLKAAIRVLSRLPV